MGMPIGEAHKPQRGRGWGREDQSHTHTLVWSHPANIILKPQAQVNLDILGAQ